MIPSDGSFKNCRKTEVGSLSERSDFGRFLGEGVYKSHIKKCVMRDYDGCAPFRTFLITKQLSFVEETFLRMFCLLEKFFPCLSEMYKKEVRDPVIG